MTTDNKLQNKLSVKQTLSRFTQALFQDNDLAAALKCILQITNADHIQIFHRIPPYAEKGTLVCLAYQSRRKNTQALDRQIDPAEQTPLLIMLDSGKFRYHNYINKSLSDKYINYSLPLIVEKQRFGIINLLFSIQNKGISTDQKLMLSTLICVLNHYLAQMKHQIERERQENILKLAAYVSHALSTEDDFDRAITGVLEIMKMTTDYAFVVILTRHANATISPRYSLSHYLGEEEIKDVFAGLWEQNIDLWDPLLQLGAPFVIESRHPADYHSIALIPGFVQSVNIPIYSGNQLWGVLSLISNRYGHHLKSQHITALTPIADSIGNAIIRKNTQISLIQAKEASDRANRSKSAFLANMSHEIRTPMNAIMGFAQMLKQTKQTVEQADYTSVILDSGNALLSIINDVLDLANLEIGKTKVSINQCSLAQIVEKLWLQYQPIIISKGISPVLKLKPGIPLVSTDIDKLSRILNSLLSNAVKFTDTGTIELRMDHKQIQKGKCEVVIEVNDTGIGISADKMDVIFNIFEQADNTITRRYSGMGLGLGLTSRIVKTLGGEISVQSKLTQGSSFRLRFIFDCTAPMSDIDLTRRIKKNSKEFNILLAEDNSINRMLIVKLLMPMKWTVFQVKNGAEVLDLLQKEQDIDLILMDVHMPVVSGLEATQAIKSDEKLRHIPVIALTASVLRDDRDRCNAAGVDDFIEKPIQSERLLEVVNKWLQSAQSLSQVSQN